MEPVVVSAKIEQIPVNSEPWAITRTNVYSGQ